MRFLDSSKSFTAARYTSDGLLRAVRLVGYDRQEWEVGDDVGLTVQLNNRFYCRCDGVGSAFADAAVIGRTFVSGPGDRARVTIEGDCRVIQLKLPRKTVDDLLLKDHDQPSGFEGVRQAASFIDLVLLSRLSSAMTLHGELREVAIGGIVARLASYAYRQSSFKRRGLSPAVVRRVRDAIYADPKDISVARMAAISGLSLFHFSREFLWETGQTPWRFVTQVRLWSALDLFYQGLDPSQIALQVGFADTNHMGHVFKRTFGVSTGQARKLLFPK